MPKTINGIGTCYVGKHNVIVLPGVCRSCFRETRLSSYETRLFFSVLYVPLIPLWRKKVVEHCPHCQRHYAKRPSEFEEKAKASLVEAIEAYRGHPCAETAWDLHGKFLAYHHPEEAQTFREEVLEDFPADAELRVGLASQLQVISQSDAAATDLYVSALKLQPDLPEARIGVATGKVLAGRLDEARALLDFLMEPGASEKYPLNLLEELARRYQARGDHEAALELLEHLVSEFPEARHQHAARRMIRKSEIALKNPDSILPPEQRPFFDVLNPWSSRYSSRQRATVAVVVATVAIVFSLGMRNDWVRKHRKLHIVNGLNGRVVVQVDDLDPLPVLTSHFVEVAEGRHTVKVLEPFQFTQHVEMSVSFWDRFTKRPAWVVNVLGAAEIYEIHMIYSEDPPDPEIESHFGDRFLFLPHVDYLLEEPPATIPLDGNREVAKIGLQTWPTDRIDILASIEDAELWLETAHALLACHPDDFELVDVYRDSIIYSKYVDEAIAFLRTQLTRRPVPVGLHRIYQSLMEDQGRLDELVQQYEDALRGEPENSNLCYLRARIASDPARIEELIQKAIKYNPDSYWPWYQKGYQAMMAGDWKTACEHMNVAVKLGFPHPLSAYCDIVLCNCGRGKDLLGDMEVRVRSSPFREQYTWLWIEVTAAEESMDLAFERLDEWRELTVPYQDDPQVLNTYGRIQCCLLYDMEAFDALKATLDKYSDLIDSNYFLSAMSLAQGDAQRVIDEELWVPGIDVGWQQLQVALVLQQQGRTEDAAHYRALALETLSNGNRDGRRAAKLLAQDDSPTIAQLQWLSVSIPYKLLVLCTCAQLHPELRPEIVELARSLNYRHAPPYHLVNRILPEVASPQETDGTIAQKSSVGDGSTLTR